MTVSEYIMDHLTIADMAGLWTYLFLVCFAVVGALALRYDEHVPSTWTVSILVMCILTPVAWTMVSGFQYLMLSDKMSKIQELEETLVQYDGLTPHPYLVELDDRKDDLIKAMKDTGDFGDYESVYDNVESLTNVRSYTQNALSPFVVESMAKACFNMETMPTALRELTTNYPFSFKELQILWDKEAYEVGVTNPACLGHNIVKNIAPF